MIFYSYFHLLFSGRSLMVSQSTWITPGNSQSSRYLEAAMYIYIYIYIYVLILVKFIYITLLQFDN